MNDVVEAAPSPASFLSVGLAVKLSLTLDGQKVMYGSTLLGWKDHAWLVCEWPLPLSPDQRVESGTPCTVSYLHDGKLVGYRSEIRDLVASPVPLLFVAYPKTVEEIHLRKHLRVSADEPILLMQGDMTNPSMSVLPAKSYFGGLLKDLSGGGCSVTVVRRPAWLRSGSTVRLEFELPGLGHITNLTGVVKNVDIRHGSETIGLEFRFDEMEYIEYRGWGGSVKNAIEQCVFQRASSSLLTPQ
ncbi:MAG: flagellar brake protein [Nitrospira sp.]|nr:flagellar brake protein [Nitrospira sp.]MDH4302528.1 flagellar brake protein [Nitrospira sp.]MDH5193337.1 flagellar brake protein [Nitrospira sp.]